MIQFESKKKFILANLGSSFETRQKPKRAEEICHALVSSTRENHNNPLIRLFVEWLLSVVDLCFASARAESIITRWLCI